MLRPARPGGTCRTPGRLLGRRQFPQTANSSSYRIDLAATHRLAHRTTPLSSKLEFHSGDHSRSRGQWTAFRRRGGARPARFDASCHDLDRQYFRPLWFLSAPILGGDRNHTRLILKIQDGCNSRCSYCVIPFVRGKSRSLPPETVLQEIQRLSDSGFREIVLSGINLGTYGRDLSPRVEFEDLLRRILDETHVQHLRISSIEPLDVTQDLIDLFAGSDRVAQHFHMPLQSASDRILAAMHRWYRAEHYARRVELIHERLPHAAIGADVITGFPGETEADQAATFSFIERLPFTYLHVFCFSKRPGTQAANLSSEVPAPIIKRRARALRALGEQKAAAFRSTQLGRTLRVLTLRGDDTDTYSPSGNPRAYSPPRTTPALSTNYLRVRIPGSFPANSFLDVLISGEEGNSLVGDPAAALSESSASLR